MSYIEDIRKDILMKFELSPSYENVGRNNKSLKTNYKGETK